mmetsp:Transcript_17800/g.62452  ORF Transcript_17800/g.62452 Transcript_17800/m.62452 type:complete len:481 (+) Transcript_17800:1006-2448(+)
MCGGRTGGCTGPSGDSQGRTRAPCGGTMAGGRGTAAAGGTMIPGGMIPAGGAGSGGRHAGAANGRRPAWALWACVRAASAARATSTNARSSSEVFAAATTGGDDENDDVDEAPTKVEAAGAVGGRTIGGLAFAITTTGAGAAGGSGSTEGPAATLPLNSSTFLAITAGKPPCLCANTSCTPSRLAWSYIGLHGPCTFTVLESCVDARRRSPAERWSSRPWKSLQTAWWKPRSSGPSTSKGMPAGGTEPGEPDDEAAAAVGGGGWLGGAGCPAFCAGALGGGGSDDGSDADALLAAAPAAARTAPEAVADQSAPPRGERLRLLSARTAADAPGANAPPRPPRCTRALMTRGTCFKGAALASSLCFSASSSASRASTSPSNNICTWRLVTLKRHDDSDPPRRSSAPCVPCVPFLPQKTKGSRRPRASSRPPPFEPLPPPPPPPARPTAWSRRRATLLLTPLLTCWFFGHSNSASRKSRDLTD